MRLKNASGTTVFDTTNRYIKTTSPGSVNLAAVSPAPFPDGSVTLADGAGYLYFVGSMMYKTVNTTLTLPTVANPGYLQFRRLGWAMNGGGAGPIYYPRQGTLAQVLKNGTHVLNIEHYVGILVDGSGMHVTGVVHVFELADTAETIITSPHNISVGPNDVISFVYKRYVALDPGTYSVNGIDDYTIFYYSDLDTLPLVVTA